MKNELIPPRAWVDGQYWEVLKINYSEKICTLANRKEVAKFHIDAIAIESPTGRRDNDGKNIYQGDIITNECSNYFHVVFWSDRLLSWRFIPAMFYKTHADKDNDCISFDFAYFSQCDGRIIGNINQNPELIKESE